MFANGTKRSEYFFPSKCINAREHRADKIEFISGVRTVIGMFGSSGGAEVCQKKYLQIPNTCSNIELNAQTHSGHFFWFKFFWIWTENLLFTRSWRCTRQKLSIESIFLLFIMICGISLVRRFYLPYINGIANFIPRRRSTRIHISLTIIVPPFSSRNFGTVVFAYMFSHYGSHHNS